MTEIAATGLVDPDERRDAPLPAEPARPADRAPDDDAEFAELPPKRQVPALTKLLVVGILVAISFAGGVLVQKQHDASQTSALPASPGGAGRPPGLPHGSRGDRRWLVDRRPPVDRRERSRAGGDDRERLGRRHHRQGSRGQDARRPHRRNDRVRRDRCRLVNVPTARNDREHRGDEGGRRYRDRHDHHAPLMRSHTSQRLYPHRSTLQETRMPTLRRMLIPAFVIAAAIVAAGCGPSGATAAPPPPLRPPPLRPAPRTPRRSSNAWPRQGSRSRPAGSGRGRRASCPRPAGSGRCRRASFPRPAASGRCRRASFPRPAASPVAPRTPRWPLPSRRAGSHSRPPRATPSRTRSLSGRSGGRQERMRDPRRRG